MGENRRFPSPSYTQSSPSIANSSWISTENWVAVEDPIREVLNCIYPTLDSEEKRKDVIEYIQKLIRSSVAVEVFPYGSVPLKTYLPDGDIDLTVLCAPNRDELLPQHVLSVLRNHEEDNENTEFELKDIQFIDAEVKLVKFIIQDMVIDLSFNQLGGLCSLGFLERLDRLIGRDHIFKRSIMLIKTWCYYESHILGAHHGLISTYALEILVLYIFHLFGATLTSPFMTFYRFLDYFSSFDWDNYGISLNGPVIKAYLPHIFVENRINQGTGGLLSGEHLKSCVDMFMVPLKLSETNVRAFPIKHFNIVDPLKESNNIGRSVNRGNYYRIKCALKYGASKLREILESPTENVGIGIKKFFINTIQNHKSRCNLDATFRSLSSSSSSDANYEDENADLDDYLSGNDNIEKVDLFAFRSLNLKPANELADGDTNSVDGYFPDLKKRDAIGGTGETENLNPFADLTGDYDSHVRSLLYGQCCHGYALSSALFDISGQASFYGGCEPWEVAANPWNGPFQPSSSGPQMNPNNAVNRHGPYVAGQNIGRAGEPVRWEERNPGRGTGTYFPVMNSSRGRGKHRGHFSSLSQQHWIRSRGPAAMNRGPAVMNQGPAAMNRGPAAMHRGPAAMNRGPAAMNRGPAAMNRGPVDLNRGPVQMNHGSGAIQEGRDPIERSAPPSHGHVGSPSGVNRRRKLEFGSFGPVPEPTSDAVYGRRPGRESFHLKNEDEFPPLSA